MSTQPATGGGDETPASARVRQIQQELQEERRALERMAKSEKRDAAIAKLDGKLTDLMHVAVALANYEHDAVQRRAEFREMRECCERNDLTIDGTCKLHQVLIDAIDSLKMVA